MEKPNLALLLAGPAKGKDEPDDASEHEEMCKSAMADFIAAVHSKDVEKAHQALGDYLELELEEREGDEEAPEPDQEEGEE